MSRASICAGARIGGERQEQVLTARTWRGLRASAGVTAATGLGFSRMMIESLGPSTGCSSSPTVLRSVVTKRLIGLVASREAGG